MKLQTNLIQFDYDKEDCRPVGNASAKIALVGEAPGEQEQFTRRPFMGGSGQELRRMLEVAGINMEDCFITNVFMKRPFNNKLEEHFCASKKEVGGKAYKWAQISSGKYIKPEYLYHVQRLKEELEAVKPNIVIALGRVAAWALLGDARITKLRGTIAESSLIPGLKVLPTFHPAMILRDWSSRPIAIIDMMKAKRESESPEIIRPSRILTLEPTLEDLDEYWPKLESTTAIAYDIETAPSRRLITSIGFAPSPYEAIVVPFVDFTKPGYSYWPDAESETKAWEWVKRVLALPNCKRQQNGLYDIQWLWHDVGIYPAGSIEDTMIMAHAQASEMPKGLDFLGSIYTDEAAWKLMSARHRSNKQDE